MVKTILNEQLTYSDGLAMRIVYEALEANDLDKILRMDQLIFVQSIPKETRVGAKQMGTRMVKLAMELYDSEWINWYHEQMKNKKPNYIQLFASLCLAIT